jgi:hypothetical protein
MALRCKGNELLELNIQGLRRKIEMIKETPGLSITTEK